MDLPQNRFKRGLAAGEVQIGLWTQIASPISTEVAAGAGFDLLVIDAEHAPNDVTTVLPLLQVCAGYPVSAVVRPPWSDMVLVKRYLDIGAQTLLIPFIDTPEQAAEAVAFTRYPPEGVRGVATCHRANRFARVPDYHAKAASELCLLVQIETRRGLDNLEGIAAVEGIDGIFIGPSDLAASFGHLGQPGHPEVQAAIAEVPARLRASGKPAGILSPVEEVALNHIGLGYRFVAVGSDLALLAGQTAALAGRFARFAP